MTVERLREMRGTALPLRGNDIDTDRIIPARFLKAITFEGLEAHLFEDDRAQAGPAGQGLHPTADPRYAGASIMLVQSNFGCGSSREHAPQAIRRRGIRMVIGQSFSEIFFGNAVALGMPCPTAARADIDDLIAMTERDPSLEIAVDLAGMTATAGGRTFALTLPDAVREALLDGSWDATGLLLDQFDRVRAVAAGLPYVSGNW